MTTNVNSTNNRRWIFILIGVIVVCFLITSCIGVVGLITYLTVSEANSRAVDAIPDANVELWVDDDGCGVIRSAVEGESPVSSLIWVIQDQDGYSVLERNAENEYQYRYFVSGTYTVSIKAWYEGAYHQISDEVIIQCR